jgi:hypothetical protein
MGFPLASLIPNGSNISTISQLSLLRQPLEQPAAPPCAAPGSSLATQRAASGRNPCISLLGRLWGLWHRSIAVRQSPIVYCVATQITKFCQAGPSRHIRRYKLFGPFPASGSFDIPRNILAPKGQGTPLPLQKGTGLERAREAFLVNISSHICCCAEEPICPIFNL